MELLHPSHHAFPRYMHIAEPESELMSHKALEAKRDSGMGGRIADRLALTTDARLDALEQRAVLGSYTKSSYPRLKNRLLADPGTPGFSGHGAGYAP